MPHAARLKSETGYYHVISKGVANQILFESDGDYRTYLKYLSEAKDLTGIRIHAYCLMSNHVHHVVQDIDDRLSELMKYVDERYGSYYANRIGRVGGVFSRPFWSEPISTDSRLLCAVRYVHANPAHAGICKASAYEWSSVKSYLGRRDGLADTNVVLGLAGGRESFIRFSAASNATAVPFIGSRLRNHTTDAEALRIAEDILGHDPRKGTTVVEGKLLKERGFTASQISRITGLGRRQV